MSAQVLTEHEEASATTVPRASESIVYGGLVVGILDGLAATINAGLKGVSPARVFQFIASGLLGNNSYSGGASTILLGLAFHFLIAFGAVTMFYVISLRFPILWQRALLFGPIYGIIVFFVMRELVVPLSLIAKQPFSLSGLVTGIIIHILFVGLPIALVVRWSVNSKADGESEVNQIQS